MYTTSISVKVPAGVDMEAIIDSVNKASQPRVSDLLYAGQRQRTRILERTARGVDVNESSFAAYSEKGPYYYYPSANAKDKRAAVLRAAKKLGIRAKGGPNRQGETVTSTGIKFPSYGAFKRALGRTNVDLRGPKAPHMLQSLIVKVAGFTIGRETETEAGNNKLANEIVIGIYGEEASRAIKHNQGLKPVPRRKFFSANETDKTSIVNDIMARAANRVRKALKGQL